MLDPTEKTSMQSKGRKTSVANSLDSSNSGADSRIQQPNDDMKDYTTTVTILESITDAIFILNSNGTIEYSNQSAQNYLQFPLQDIIGAPLDRFVQSSDEAELRDLDKGLRKSQKQNRFNSEVFGNSEAELIGANETIPVLINSSIIPDSKGKLKYIIVTAKEIAYRKSLELELKNRQALSVSFDRLKALGEMSVGLAHTLGQPVTAMELRLDQISRLDDIQTIQNQVAELRKDISSISGIVEKVRSYAQTMAGKQNRPLNINSTLSSILKVLEYDLSEDDVTLELNLLEDLASIDANEPELEQVFINIITNAMQAFKENDIARDRTIVINTETEENKWIKMSIQDNAGGVEDSIAEKIFEPFFSSWDEREHAGTGLSIARSILSSLGGDLNYHKLENGSSFELRIPITQNEERTQLFNLIELLNN